MDHKDLPLASDYKERDEGTQVTSSKLTEMGFYETVASRQASASNRRAFRVSVDDPTFEDSFEAQKEEKQGKKHVMGSLTTPQIKVEESSPLGIKLPLISNIAVIANSSSYI